MEELWKGDVDYHRFKKVNGKLFFYIKDYFGYRFQRVHGTGMEDTADYALVDESNENVIGYEVECGRGGFYLDESVIEKPRPKRPKTKLDQRSDLIGKYLCEAFDRIFKEEAIKSLGLAPCEEEDESEKHNKTKGELK